MNQHRRKEDFEVVNKWWHFVRPYWHVLSFCVTIIVIMTMNWTKVSAYDGRLVALELWRIDVSAKQEQDHQDIAVMKQEVHDIHERILGK